MHGLRCARLAIVCASVGGTSAIALCVSCLWNCLQFADDCAFNMTIALLSCVLLVTCGVLVEDAIDAVRYYTGRVR